MKAKAILILFLAATFSLKGQSSIDLILAQIEKNNSALKVLASRIDAQKTQSKTGIFLSNPELGFNYLWNDNSISGNRMDIHFQQSFEFPTAYSYKRKMADGMGMQSDVFFAREKVHILHEARLLCVDLIYQNKLKSELNRRLQVAGQIAEMFQVRFNAGEIGIIEFNKAKLNLLNAQKDFESVEIEQTASLMKLIAMNGGVSVSFADTLYQTSQLPVDFENWFLKIEQNNPEYNLLKKESELNLLNEKLCAALALPRFSTGFMSERNSADQFQGITVGISIPLWEHKNTVKYARSNTISSQLEMSEYQVAFRIRLKTLFDKAVSLERSLEDYSEVLSTVNNTDLLLKALNKGEISMLDYVTELSFYYATLKNVLEIERDYQKTVAELLMYQ